MIRNRLLVIAAVLALVVCSLGAAEKPNVVLIYGDDIGYADVGVNGSKLIPTPNIDKLAASGINFTDGHCTSATCSPSRFSLLAGIHAFRKGVRIIPPDGPLCIPTDITTLPGIFKKAGYHTAVIGKWHLGLGARGRRNNWNGKIKPGPLEIGFDRSFLLPYTNDRVPCVYLEGHRVVKQSADDPIYVRRFPAGHKSTVYPDGRKNPEAMTYYKNSHGHNHTVINGIGRIGTMVGGKEALWDDEGMADVFVEKATEYIKKHKKKPFFLFFSSQDIHVPRAPHPRFHGKTKLGYRGDAMVQLDWATGAIMKALEDNGLTKKTIVIFSSDNGPVYDDGYRDGTTVKPKKGEVDRGHDGSGPFRGGKYQIYEGGTRVPFIISWPGTIKAGVTSKALVNQIDLAASFAGYLGIELGEDECRDSRDTWDAFIGKDEKGLPYMLEEARGLALRKGNWKYIAAKGRQRQELYNLQSDVGEQNNLVEKHPEIAAGMLELLNKLKDPKGIRNNP